MANTERLTARIHPDPLCRTPAQYRKPVADIDYSIEKFIF